LSGREISATPAPQLAAADHVGSTLDESEALQPGGLSRLSDGSFVKFS